MFKSSVAELFPLPLAAFERYMLLDDRPDYPMVFAIRLNFLGEIRRREFESALTETLPSHPLLCALAKRSTHRKPTWELGETSPNVDWNGHGVPIGNVHGGRIDLSSEPGLRLWVRQGNGTAEVTVRFHHASCDGVGALRFIGHLLAAYAAKTSPQQGRCPALPRSDPTSLLRRECLAASPSRPRPSGRFPAIWNSVRDGVRWLKRQPAVLASSVPDARSDPTSLPCLGMECHALDRSETTRLGQIAARQGGTLNDLLLRDMFQTLRQWTLKHPSASAATWLRIAIPVNLKTGSGERLSAANGVSYTFVTRHPNECDNAQKLLQSIHGETDAATCRRRSLMFLRGFCLMEHIPGAIPLYMSMRRCFATAVLSNLGEITRHLGVRFPRESGKIVAGNLILEDIFGVPPVRPNTRAAFMIGIYSRRLGIALRADPLVFSPADARRLLALYVEQLRGTIDAAVESME